MARKKQGYKRPTKGKTAAEKVAEENASRGKTDGFGRPLADRTAEIVAGGAPDLVPLNDAGLPDMAGEESGPLAGTTFEENGQGTIDGEPDADGQGSLIDEPPEVAEIPAERATLELTGHDAKLLARALVKQSKFLLKQAEIAHEENYPKAAQEFKSDAGIITHALLASLKQQRVLVPPTAEEAIAGVHNYLRTLLAPRIEHEYQAGRESSLVDQGKKIAARNRNELDVLCGMLARIMDQFARAVGERSYAFGLAARDQTIDAALIGALAEVRWGPDASP